MLVAGAEETPAGSTSENRQPARRCAGCEPSGRGRDGGRRLNWVRWQGCPHASAAGRDAVRPSSTRHALRAQRERGILRSEVRSEVRGQRSEQKEGVNLVRTPPSLRRPFPLTSDLASDLKRASFLEKQGRTIEKRKRDVDQLIDQLTDQTDRSMIGQLIGHA
jgi:hypothetical protein